METLAARNRMARFLGGALAVLTLLVSVAALDTAWVSGEGSAEALVLRLALGAIGLASLRLSWLLMLAARAIGSADASGAVTADTGENSGRNATVLRLSGLLLALATTFGAANATAAPVDVAATSAINREPRNASSFAGLDLPGDPSIADSDTSLNGSAPTLAPSGKALVELERHCDLTPGWLPNPDMSTCELVVGNVSPADQSQHVVTRGQTLWSIAGSYLPSGSSGEAIAQAVHEWVRANPSLLDPNAIQVGDVLVRPSIQGAAR